MATKRKERGRPLEYDPDWHPDKVRHFAFLDYNNREIAAIFGIHEDTFYDWIKKYPAFSEAIWHGKNTDKDALTKSLTKRATGFTYREKKQTWMPAHTEMQWVPDPDKPGEFKEIEVHLPKKLVEETITEKTLPADVGALRFALINRVSDKYRESAHIDHTTNGKDLGDKGLDLSLLTDEEIATLAALEAKAKKK